MKNHRGYQKAFIDVGNGAEDMLKYVDLQRGN